MHDSSKVWRPGPRITRITDIDLHQEMDAYSPTRRRLDPAFSGPAELTRSVLSERGCLSALRGSGLSVLHVQLEGDLQPSDDERLSATHDDKGR